METFHIPIEWLTEYEQECDRRINRLLADAERLKAHRDDIRAIAERAKTEAHKKQRSVKSARTQAIYEYAKINRSFKMRDVVAYVRSRLPESSYHSVARRVYDAVSSGVLEWREHGAFRSLIFEPEARQD